MCLQQVFHYGHTFRTVKVCGLGSYYFQFCVSDIVEALASVDGCGCARNTFQFSNFYAFAQQVNNVLSSQLRTQYVVGCDLTVDLNAVYRTVNGDYFNAFCFYGLDGTGNSVGVTWVYDQYGNTLSHQVFDVGNLFGHIIACVSDAQGNTGFLSGSFRAVCQSYEEWVIQGRNRKTDGAFRGRGSACGEVFFAVNGNFTASHGKYQHQAEKQTE